ncbi:MAG: DinB family protein [Bacteroidota bacterium]
MKTSRNELLGDLTQMTHSIIQRAEQFKVLDEKGLQFKASPGAWNILECLEHLNLYGDFYLVEIEKQILKSDQSPAATIFRSGWLGNYFAKMMLPKADGSISKIKTFDDKDPSKSQLPLTTIDRFLKQQDRILELLELAKNVDLSRVKTGITISNWIRLRLGDTFRVVIYHNERHMQQAERVWKQLSAKREAVKAD